jgi:hypothetical protein
MPVENGDIIRCAAEMSDTFGKEIVNVYHYRASGSGLPDSAWTDAIAAHLDNAYTNLQPGLDDGMHFNNLRFQNVTKGELMGNVAWPSLTAGGATGDGFPSQDCLVATFNTLVPKVFGRKFLGPFIEGGAAAGIWGSGNLAAAAAFVADILTAPTGLLGGSLVAGVARYAAGGLAISFIPFVSGVARNVVRAQRRRQNDRGN